MMNSATRTLILLFAFSVLNSPHFAQVSNPIKSDLESSNVELKRNALFEIRNLQTEAASRLALPLLKDGNAMVRATAAASVIFVPPLEAIAALSPLLDDRDEFVRREAAYALGETYNENAAAPLLNLLKREKKLEAKNAAIVALGKSGDIAAIASLVKILGKKADGKNEFTRRAASRSIGQIAQIIESGERIVVTPTDFLDERHKNLPQKLSTIETRSEFEAASKTLARIVQSKAEADDTRREAAFAIGAIGDTESSKLLSSLANGPDPFLAEISKEAILKLTVIKSRIEKKPAQ